MKPKYYLVESAINGRPVCTLTESRLKDVKSHFVPLLDDDDCFEDNYIVTPINLVKQVYWTYFLFETDSDEPEYIISIANRASRTFPVYGIYETLLDAIDDWSDWIAARLGESK